MTSSSAGQLFCRLEPASGDVADCGEFARYACDVEGFARDILGIELWDRQIEIANAVRDHQRVAVASCFAAGKTMLAAVLVIWWMCTRAPALVITTAPNGRSVRELLWGEIQKLVANAKRPLPGKLMQTKWRISPSRRALGFTARHKTGAQGFHETNTFVIEDEAEGIDQALSRTLEGAMVSPECRRLKIGNPGRLDGPFYGSFEGPGAASWKQFNISAFDTPNVKVGSEVIPGLVTQGWVDDQRRDMGEDSNWWRTKVLGLFPRDGVERLIPMEWIKAAQARWAQIPDGDKPRALGVDIGRGKDKTALAKLMGRRVHLGRAWQEPDTMKSVAEILRVAEGDGMEQVNIDETAVGGGVVDRCKEIQRDGKLSKSIKIRGCNLSCNARQKKKFFRLMDELWWAVRQALNPDPIVNPEPIALPQDEELAVQLNCRTYTTDSKGRIKVETKNELRKRGVKSPDKADAVALCLLKPKELAVA